MSHITRREFLSKAGKAGIAVAAANAALASSWAQTSTPVTRLAIDSARQIGTVQRQVFGSFLEHLGRAIYGGIFEPGSKLSDNNGFRTDVLKEIKDLGVPLIRYPGGNFVSGYHWQDGVGPKKDRPKVLDRAWNTMDTNQFGINDFVTWARQVGTEPLFGLNFGTGSVEDAVAEVEYCNVDKGTRWSDLRRSHGYEQPHKIKYWCIGNEMDGPWQIGHMGARDYGRKALDAAKQMRILDPNVKLIACGSSGPFMPTYLEWDREVLEECYDQADGISLHRYWGNDSEVGQNSQKYLAMNLAMDRQIEEIVAICDIVRGQKRSKKTLFLSFDEWNVWYRARSGDAVDGHRQYAPHLLEEIYNLEDALLVGGLVNSLIRHCDRVKVACLAQLVNVIAPIMTNENGLYRQTIYYPYAWALHNARGRALSLRPEGPTYDVSELGHPTESIGITGPGFGEVPYLDVSATLDEEKKSVALFILNRDLDHARQLDLNWHDLTPSRVTSFETLTGNDLKAVNSFQQPSNVAPKKVDLPRAGAKMTIELPARSYSLVTLSL